MDEKFNISFKDFLEAGPSFATVKATPTSPPKNVRAVMNAQLLVLYVSAKQYKFESFILS